MRACFARAPLSNSSLPTRAARDQTSLRRRSKRSRAIPDKGPTFGLDVGHVVLHRERSYGVYQLGRESGTKRRSASRCVTWIQHGKTSPVPSRPRSRPGPPHRYSCAAPTVRCARGSSRSLVHNDACDERGRLCERAIPMRKTCRKKKERGSVTTKERSTRGVPTSSWSSAVGSGTTSDVPLAMEGGLGPTPGEVRTRFFG